MSSIREKLMSIRSFLADQGFPMEPEAVIILGSGLGGFAEKIKSPLTIPYSNIPDFPQTTVQGHSGKLITGTIAGKNIIAFSGRFHHYEGHPFSTTVLPVQLAHHLKAKKLILSNAAGAINPRFNVGDLMVIDDLVRPFHILSASASETYRTNLYPIADKVRKIAAGIGLEIQRGSYLYVKGPNYETKAEIRAFQVLGADVVGMSTAPELMEASKLQIPAAAISLITNMAAGLQKGKLDHSDVEEAAESKKMDFTRLVSELILKM
ncbi:MAG: purine-nucleoside phosphorylase [Balneolaceae bacterium]